MSSPSNDAVVDDPRSSTADPFGDGWLVKLTRRRAPPPAELLDREAYVALTGGEE